MKKAILIPVVINAVSIGILFFTKEPGSKAELGGIILAFWGVVFIVGIFITHIIIAVLRFLFHDRQVDKQTKLINLLVYLVTAIVTGWLGLYFWIPDQVRNGTD